MTDKEFGRQAGRAMMPTLSERKRNEAMTSISEDRNQSRDLLKRCMAMVQMDIMDVDDEDRVELVEDVQAHLGEE